MGQAERSVAHILNVNDMGLIFTDHFTLFAKLILLFTSEVTSSIGSKLQHPT